ncbi:MAG: M20 family metallopeptidase [Aminobacterium sp.]
MINIQDEAKAILSEIIEWRRHIHANPELGLETPETEAYIVQALEGMGFPSTSIRKGIGGHGVAALLEGDEPGPVLAIRADCDALPIKEETGLPFAATNGCMHACAHDVHTAMALGAAQLLMKHRHELKGSVKFIFQPAEENVVGAKAMIDDGVLENPKVDALIGLHSGLLWKGYAAGEIGYSHGGMMASADRFLITLKGKGGHGATPHLTADPIVMAGHLICRLQTILSREVNPVDPGVLTIGRVTGGSAYNIIPGECVLEGTVRVLDVETRKMMEERIRELAESTAASMRGEAVVEYIPGPPPVINDSAMTDKLLATVAEVLGEEKAKEIPEPSMGAEDVAYFLERVPGTFFFHAGSNPEKGQTYPHHNSKFDIDEDTLWIGSALFAHFALNWQK